MSAVSQPAHQDANSAWARGPPPAAAAKVNGQNSLPGSVPVPIAHSRKGSLMVGGGADVKRSNIAFGTVDSDNPVLSSSPAAPSMTGAHLDSTVEEFGSIRVENGGTVLPKGKVDDINIHSLFSRPKPTDQRRQSMSQMTGYPSQPMPYMSNGPIRPQQTPRSPVPAQMQPFARPPPMQVRPPMPMQRPGEMAYGQAYPMGYQPQYYTYPYGGMTWNPMGQPMGQAMPNAMSPRGPQPTLPPAAPEQASLPNSGAVSPRPTPPSRPSSLVPTPPPPATMVRPPMGQIPPTFTPGQPFNLSGGASSFTPRKSAAVMIKRPDGTAVDFKDVAKEAKEPREKEPEQAPTPTPKKKLPTLPVIVRMESEEQKKARLEEQARQERMQKQEAQEEQERLERRQKAEAKAKEEAEAKAKAEAAETAKKAAEADAKAKADREEAERRESERKEADKKEAERKAMEEAFEAERIAEAKAEEDRAAAAKIQAASDKARAESEAAAAHAAAHEARDKADAQIRTLLPTSTPASPLPSPRIAAANLPPKPVASTSRAPPPLDSSASTSSQMSTARPIHNLDSIVYPDPAHGPFPELNKNSEPGKFRYDRDFLLQFMNICTEKPADLPKLGEIGLEADSSSGFGRKRSSVGTSRSASQGVNRTLPNPGMGAFGMGNFVPMPNRGGSRPGRVPSQPQTPMMSRTGGGRASRSGVPRRPPAFEDVAPLAVTANAWVTQRPANDEGSPAYVERKVKALLNKLTAEKFSSIADQILEYANRSATETDGTSLKLVIKLVFEKATDEAHWSSMYARLCRLLLDRLNPEITETIDGKPVSGGVLFRRYLIGRCQIDFENGWKAREDTATAAAARSEEDKQQLATKKEGEDAPMLSDEYYAAQKAKRRGLGLVQLIGELFKLEMISKNVIKTCLIRLLTNLETPDEEDIESTCKLLSTIGPSYDAISKDNVDVVFERLNIILSGNYISSRIRFMIMDVFDLRRTGWKSSKAQTGIMTIAEVHAQAAKEHAEKAAAATRESLSRGGSRAGGRRDITQPGEWQNVAGGPRPLQRPADFSNLGKASSQALPTAPSFGGPSTVFGRNKGKTTMSTPPLSRQASVSDISAQHANKFNILSGETPEKPEQKAEEPQRRKLNLQPRTKPIADDGDGEDGKDNDAAESVEDDAESEMSEEQAKAKIALDMKEIWGEKGLVGTRNPEDIVEYFRALPETRRALLASRLLEEVFRTQKLADAEIVAKGWKLAIEQGTASQDVVIKSLEERMPTLDDDAIDFPSAYKAVAVLLHSVSVPKDEIDRLAGLITVEGTPRITPQSKLEKALQALDE